jgi:hypothetical protein
MDIRLPEHLKNYCRKALASLVAAVMLCSLSVHQAYAEQSVVLIAAKGSGIESISNRDIRRIYLGLKSADSKMVNRPVINMYDREIFEDFLKNVMHMTEGSYKRKLVKRIFRNGAAEIKEIERLQELNEHLLNNVGDVSFVDSSAVDMMHDIEVVKVLW